MINAKTRACRYRDYLCPVCLYKIKLYRQTEQCKSSLHLLNNLEYGGEQQQLCILNSHLETISNTIILMRSLKNLLTRISIIQ